MVAQSFANHGFPPPAWAAVLDKHHLTWIAADDGGEGKPVTEQIGLLLDAAHNATHTWTVGPDRVYLAMCRNAGAFLGTALHYPDVFGGEIQAVSPGWFTKLKGFERPPLTWDSDLFPPPQARDYAFAKAHSRIYLADRDDGGNGRALPDAVVRHGYKQVGFKYVKAAWVPEADQGPYTDFAAGWFDDGVTFLDASLADVRAKAKPPATRPVARPLGR